MYTILEHAKMTSTTVTYKQHWLTKDILHSFIYLIQTQSSWQLKAYMH